MIDERWCLEVIAINANAFDNFLKHVERPKLLNISIITYSQSISFPVN